MGFPIADGTGNGYEAKVSDENRLQTESVVHPNFLHKNEDEKSAYVWNYPQYSNASDDTVMFLRNDSDKDLHVHHIYIYCSVATMAEVHAPASPTAAGTAVTGVNLNLKSGNVAQATAKQDETGNTQGTILHTEYIAANTPLTLFKEDGYEVILGKNDCIGVDLGQNGGSTWGHIVGYFHE